MTTPESPAPLRVRPAKKAAPLDALGAAAVDEARAAILECTSAELVGEHLAVVAEDERVVSHSFASADPAYRGWVWSVTLARASRAKQVTVSEVVLLPGELALLSPEWLPWSERLRPGDLGVGDLLLTAPDDLRLVPGYAPGVDEREDALLDDLDSWKLGRGRERVLSTEGRDYATTRWYEGASGPTAPIAEGAPAPCLSCGFFVALSGSLGTTFGVCANEYAPDDAKVVSVDHGCGAHSEVIVPPAILATDPVVDDLRVDMIDRSQVDPVVESVVEEDPAVPTPDGTEVVSEGGAPRPRARTRRKKAVPVVQEPVVQEPVVQESVVQEPVVHEPGEASSASSTTSIESVASDTPAAGSSVTPETASTDAQPLEPLVEDAEHD